MRLQEAAMASRWIVVAHSAGAKIYASDEAGREPVIWRTLEHPESRTKDIDLVADRPGRTFDSAGQGRHAMATRHSPKDRESAIFAHEIGELLEYGRTRSLYDELVLVAAPDFLGQLRGTLNDEVRKCVIAEIGKNLIDHDISSICEGLKQAC
jgi:protein required for attachment to host cells